MKKIRVTENELVDLIEKLVKENLGNGNGHNFGMLGTPTSKYKDLYEDDDVEVTEEEDNLDKLAGEKLTGQETPHDQDDMAPDGMDDASDTMESVKESKIVSRLRKKVHPPKSTKTIKEQQKQIDRLTERINKLENK